MHLHIVNIIWTIQCKLGNVKMFSYVIILINKEEFYYKWYSP